MTLIRPASVDLVRVYEEPFPYFTAVATLDQELVVSLLRWFETKARWKLVKTDFYEQHELDWTEDEQLLPISFLTDQAFLSNLRGQIAAVFNQSFANRVDCSVHKLLPGQRIRIHNDLLNAGTSETHRVILHINRGWSLSQGGLLMLFNSPDPADVHKILMPLSGSLVGFEITERSNHAVTMVHGGERFAVVYSLYAGHQNAT